VSTDSQYNVATDEAGTYGWGWVLDTVACLLRRNVITDAVNFYRIIMYSTNVPVKF
jgi:hypothetical protein